MTGMEHLKQLEPVDSIITPTPKMPQQGANGKQGDGWSTTKFMDYTTGMLGNEASANLQGRSAGEQGLLTPEQQQAAARRNAGLIDDKSKSSDNTQLLNWAKDTLNMSDEELSKMVTNLSISELSDDVQLYDWMLNKELMTPEDLKSHIMQQEDADSTGTEPAEWRTFQLARDFIINSGKSPEEKLQLLGELTQRKFGSDRGRHASTIDTNQLQRIREGDPTIAKGLTTIRASTQNQQQSTNAYKGLVLEAERVLSLPIGKEEKYAELLPTMRIFIEANLPTSSMDKKNLDGYKSIIAQTQRVKALVKENEGKGVFDLSNTGFFQNMILSMTSGFGFVLPSQTILAEMDISNNVTLAEFIRSISGLTVTEEERQFLGKMMYRIRDTGSLTKAKMRGWMKIISNYLTRTYENHTGSTELARAMAENVIGMSTPAGYFDFEGNYIEETNVDTAKKEMRKFASENPEATVEEITNDFLKDFQGKLSDVDLETMKTFVKDTFGKSYDKIKTHIQNNMNEGIDDVYKKAAEGFNIDPKAKDFAKELEKTLKDLQEEVSTIFNDIQEGTSEISQNSIEYIYNLKILQREATLYKSSSEFIEAITKTLSEDVRAIQGWTDQKLVEMWNKANGVTDVR